MRAQQFLKKLNEDEILRAIAEAEARTSGEIRLFVSHKPAGDALTAAQKQFALLGMEKTLHRNGVLLYFAPASQRFAIVGDSGVHQKCGNTFWEEISSLMAERLRMGQSTQAITAAIQRVGDLLAKHFPRDPDDRNELPDQIAHG